MVLKNNSNNNGNYNNIVTYLARCIYMYILTSVAKILHFFQIKVQGIKSARLASMHQCNYTTDGIFNLHIGCLSVHRGSGGGGIVYH